MKPLEERTRPQHDETLRLVRPILVVGREAMRKRIGAEKLQTVVGLLAIVTYKGAIESINTEHTRFHIKSTYS